MEAEGSGAGMDAGGGIGCPTIEDSSDELSPLDADAHADEDLDAEARVAMMGM